MDYGTLPDVKDMTDDELLAELPTRRKLAAHSITPGQDMPSQNPAEHVRRLDLEEELRARGVRF